MRGVSAITPLVVSDELRRVSRLESSAIIWLAYIERYLILSDDTDFKNANDLALKWIPPFVGLSSSLSSSALRNSRRTGPASEIVVQVGLPTFLFGFESLRQ